MKAKVFSFTRLKEVRAESREMSDEHRVAQLTIEISDISEQIRQRTRDLEALKLLRQAKETTMEYILRRIERG